MSTTGIASPDLAPRVAAEWPDRPCGDLGRAGKPRACLLPRETLRAVRDLPAVDEAAGPAARPPLLIRGICHEGWNPSTTPAPPRSRKDLLARIEACFGGEPLEDAGRAVAARSDLPRRHVRAGGPDHARQSMRKTIRGLWM